MEDRGFQPKALVLAILITSAIAAAFTGITYLFASGRGIVVGVAVLVILFVLVVMVIYNAIAHPNKEDLRGSGD